jgi:crotonobetainyl-CoA:carnitine CoA-transferase CaiB-like acyl-CoA transferase
MTKTKKELWQNILKRRLFGAPVADAADIAHDPQLKSREYFVTVDHAGLGRKLTLPGAFAKMSETPVGPQGAAPQLGEHNHEVYGGLLGLSKQEIIALRAAGAI